MTINQAWLFWQQPSRDLFELVMRTRTRYHDLQPHLFRIIIDCVPDEDYPKLPLWQEIINRSVARYMGWNPELQFWITDDDYIREVLHDK